MKCDNCHESYALDRPVSSCSFSTERLCPRCRLKSADAHKCDLNCQSALTKKIDYNPMTDGFMGLGEMTHLTTTTEECLPTIYELIYAEISKLEITLVDMKRIKVELKAKLHANPKLPDNIYSFEHWKTTHMLEELKERGYTGEHIQNPGPLLLLRLDSNLRIAPDTIVLKANNNKINYAVSDRHDYIGLPTSEPLPDIHGYVERPPRKEGTFYGGKFSAIYAPIQVEEEYEIKFEIEAYNPLYVIEFLFPFGYIDVKEFSLKDDRGAYRVAQPRVFTLQPKISKELTAEFEKKFNRKDDEFPDFERAVPYRSTPSIPGADERKYISEPIRESNILRLSNYEIIGTQFQLMYDTSKIKNKLLIHTKITDREIPIRTYQLMQELPEYRDFLIEIDITNPLTNRHRYLEVECEIVGYTEKITHELIVHKVGNNTRAREIINLCPPLKFGVLESMSQPASGVLRYSVYEKYGGKRILVHSDSKNVKLLSNEQIIWGLKDIRSGAKYMLEPTISSWIEPFDPDGKLEEIRKLAGKYHRKRKLRGNIDKKASLEEQTEDIRAIYEYLNKDLKIVYKLHPFHYGEEVNAQRILTALQVIDSKAGVCIDLVILFASLMEGMGINPYLIISSDHAFIGWGSLNSIKNMRFLETTALGMKKNKSLIGFEQASKDAEENFKKNFMLGEADTIRSGMLTRIGKVIVDLDKARKTDAIKKIE